MSVKGKLLAKFTFILLINACVWVFSPVAEAIIKLESLVVALPFDE